MQLLMRFEVKIKQILEAKYANRTVVVQSPDKTGGLYLHGGWLFNADELRETYVEYDEDGVAANDPEVQYEDSMILSGDDYAELLAIDEGMAALEIWDSDRFSYEGPVEQGDKPLFVIPHDEYEKAINSRWLIVQ